MATTWESLTAGLSPDAAAAVVGAVTGKHADPPAPAEEPLTSVFIAQSPPSAPLDRGPWLRVEG